MAVTYNYYLEKLKYDITKAIKENNNEYIDPILVTEFKKAIKSITPEYWEQIKDLFIQNIEFTFSYDEQMSFTILASQLGLDFLSKNPEFCGELASILPAMQKSPLNYSKYAQIFLVSPLHELINNTVENSMIISYFEIFRAILSKIETPKPTEEDFNYIFKHLYRLNEKTYTILIDEKDLLSEIYFKLYTKMKEENKKGLLYSYSDFKRLTTILNIIKENNNEKCEELKKIIIEIEKENYSSKTIIHDILNELKNFKKIIFFTRRKQNGSR